MEHAVTFLKNLTRPWAWFILIFGVCIAVASVLQGGLVAPALVFALLFVAAGAASLSTATRNEQQADLARLEERIHALEAHVQQDTMLLGGLYDLARDFRNVWLTQLPKADPDDADHAYEELASEAAYDAYHEIRGGPTAQDVEKARHWALWARARIEHPKAIDAHYLQNRLEEMTHHVQARGRNLP